MSVLTAADLAFLAAELGLPLDETDVQTRYDRLGTVTGTALEVVRERLATMLAKSASVTLTGVMSRDNSTNIRALQEQVGRLTVALRAEEAAAGAEDTSGLAAVSVVAGRRDRPR